MLVNAYVKRVFNLAYQFAGSYQEAEDMTQDIFLKLYGALPKVRFPEEFHGLAPDARQEPTDRRLPQDKMGEGEPG